MTSLPQVAPRIAKLTALSIGVALLATACGGTSTPTSTGSDRFRQRRGHRLPGTQRWSWRRNIGRDQHRPGSRFHHHH